VSGRRYRVLAHMIPGTLSLSVLVLWAIGGRGGGLPPWLFAVAGALISALCLLYACAWLAIFAARRGGGG